MDPAPLLFAPLASRAFGERVAACLGTPLAPLEEREYEGGEHKSRPLVSVRGRVVYVIQSLSGDEAGSANDRLCRVLFLIAALKDAGATRVTACLPYIAYSRKDRRTKERDPVNSRYIAQLLEAMGVDHVMVMDVHNVAAFENAFRCSVDLLEAAPLLADQDRQAGGRQQCDHRVAGFRRRQACATRAGARRGACGHARRTRRLRKAPGRRRGQRRPHHRPGRGQARGRRRRPDQRRHHDPACGAGLPRGRRAVGDGVCDARSVRAGRRTAARSRRTRSPVRNGHAAAHAADASPGGRRQVGRPAGVGVVRRGPATYRRG